MSGAHQRPEHKERELWINTNVPCAVMSMTPNRETLRVEFLQGLRLVICLILGSARNAKPARVNLSGYRLGLNPIRLQLKPAQGNLVGLKNN